MVWTHARCPWELVHGGKGGRICCCCCCIAGLHAQKTRSPLIIERKELHASLVRPGFTPFSPSCNRDRRFPPLHLSPSAVGQVPLLPSLSLTGCNKMSAVGRMCCGIWLQTSLWRLEKKSSGAYPGGVQGVGGISVCRGSTLSVHNATTTCFSPHFSVSAYLILEFLQTF